MQSGFHDGLRFGAIGYVRLGCVSVYDIVHKIIDAVNMEAFPADGVFGTGQFKRRGITGYTFDFFKSELCPSLYQ